MKNKSTFKDLLLAFLDGASEGVSATGTLKIQGDQIIHFNTPIVERNCDRFLVNISRYSLVTGQFQKMVRNTIPAELQVVVKKVPLDYKGSLRDFLD